MITLKKKRQGFSMDIINKIKKYSALRFSAGLVVIGIIFMIFGGIAAFNPSKNMEKTTATITNIEVIGSDTADDTSSYLVSIKYKAHGRTYESVIGAYETGWEVGNKIEVSYDYKDPESVSYGDSNTVIIIVFIAGALATAYGVISFKKGMAKSSDDYAQYDRVKNIEFDPEKRAEVENNTEPRQDYVFHFTGKLNQSYVMKSKTDKEVYEAICDGIKLVKDTDFEFVNRLTGEKQEKKIGHTVTTTVNMNNLFGGNITSAFNIDGKNCWDALAEMGYSFKFSLNGAKCHYDVEHYGVPVGSIETAGTEVMNKKYENNPLAKIPANGIFRISCQPSEIDGMFMITFCITKTNITVT